MSSAAVVIGALRAKIHKCSHSLLLKYIIHVDNRSEKGYYHHVYRGKDKQWHFADSGMKNRNQDMTITLPRGKEFYRLVPYILL